MKLRKKRLIKKTKRLEDIIKSHKWKTKEGVLLSPEEVENELFIHGYMKSFSKYKCPKQDEYNIKFDYLVHLKDICDKTNIKY